MQQDLAQQETMYDLQGKQVRNLSAVRIVTISGSICFNVKNALFFPFKQNWILALI